MKSGDEIQTIVDGVTFQSVLESYADSRTNEAVTSAVANYEKKYNLKNGKPIQVPLKPSPKPEPLKPTEEEIPPYIKAQFRCVGDIKFFTYRLATL